MSALGGPRSVVAAEQMVVVGIAEVILSLDGRG